jgi:heme/copper-type cytochrome/quinol oxidase subunit 1
VDLGQPKPFPELAVQEWLIVPQLVMQVMQVFYPQVDKAAMGYFVMAPLQEHPAAAVAVAAAVFVAAAAVVEELALGSQAAVAAVAQA